MNGWVITRDYGEPDTDDLSRVGTGQVDEEIVHENSAMIFGRKITVDFHIVEDQIDNPVKFRLCYDDKDEHGNWEKAFSGVISRDWLDSSEEDLAFAPLSFAEADVGATIMLYYEDNEWKHL